MPSLLIADDHPLFRAALRQAARDTLARSIAGSQVSQASTVRMASRNSSSPALFGR